MQVEIDSVEQSRKDLRNKLLGRIDEVQDDVKQIKQLVDTNLDDMAKSLLAKSTKDSRHINFIIIKSQRRLKKLSKNYFQFFCVTKLFKELLFNRGTKIFCFCH